MPGCFNITCSLFLFYMPVCFNFTCDLVILFYSEINLLLFFYNYMLFDMKIKRVDSIFSETQIFLFSGTNLDARLF